MRRCMRITSSLVALPRICLQVEVKTLDGSWATCCLVVRRRVPQLAGAVVGSHCMQAATRMHGLLRLSDVRAVALAGIALPSALASNATE